MPQRNETFSRTLKAAISSIAMSEGKTIAAIEQSLGEQLGVADATIERYKGGQVPTEHERIKLLAEAAVQRGFMNREWLQRFLDAARYHDRQKLLDQLCPLGPARSRPERIYENLPTPTYNQFVMREQAFADVLDGLQQRSAVVLIVGLGGNGKTSLAREIAARCLNSDSDRLRFDAVVWISDKDRPGTTNLSIVLDEIARTLDYPGFTQFEHDDKRYEVEQLLRRQRVLLVIDNFETITDGALLSWLLRLPEPSKGIVTTREFRREFRSSWPIELRGMREEEAHTLVNQRLHMLRMEQLVSDIVQLEPLLAVTGGNPKAIEIALGLVKYERRPLQQVVDDLHAARGELFDDLFARAWSLLDEAARRVLLVMTFFPTSASSDALAATADVQGYSFERTVERLVDLALLDVQQVDLAKEPRYALHPLVRVFANKSIDKNSQFIKAGRERWINWYIDLTSQAGYTWNNLSQLDFINQEQETIYEAITWAEETHRCTDMIKISRAVEYYFYIKGYWDKVLYFDIMRANAAKELSLIDEEMESLSFYVQIASKKGDIAEAEKHLPRLYNLGENSQINTRAFFEYQRAIAYYFMASYRLEEANEIWSKLLPLTENLSINVYIVNHHWFGLCLYQQNKLEEAQKILKKTLYLAEQAGFHRAIFGASIQLAAIALDKGNFEQATDLLSTTDRLISHYQDRENLARTQSLCARLHTLRGDLPAAHASLTEAIDLFERLGMRRELAEAQQALIDLEAKINQKPADTDHSTAPPEIEA